MQQRTDVAASGSASTGDRREIVLVAAATLLNALLATALLLFAGADSDGTELALRTTARVSFVWFVLTFVASPIHQLWPSSFSDWLLRRRRAFGIIFGFSMSLHVGFILRLFELHAPQRPPMVTDADFLIGIPGLIMVALMTITSLDAFKQRLGPRRWQLLHSAGSWLVWSIFFLCLVDSVGRKNTDHPLSAYYAFIIVLLMGLSLRIVAARQRRVV